MFFWNIILLKRLCRQQVLPGVEAAGGGPGRTKGTGGGGIRARTQTLTWSTVFLRLTKDSNIAHLSSEVFAIVARTYAEVGCVDERISIGRDGWCVRGNRSTVDYNSTCHAIVCRSHLVPLPVCQTRDGPCDEI